MFFQKGKQRLREVDSYLRTLSQEAEEQGLKPMSIIIKVKFPHTELHGVPGGWERCLLCSALCPGESAWQTAGTHIC